METGSCRDRFVESLHETRQVVTALENHVLHTLISL